MTRFIFWLCLPVELLAFLACTVQALFLSDE